MTAPGLDRLNALPPGEAESELRACCGCAAWARRMAAQRPFRDEGHLFATADAAWWSLGPADWLEAFRAHPRIGERKAAAEQTERERRWSAQEQAGARGGGEAAGALAEGNRAYEDRFGHVFLICATGKTGEAMLAALRARLANDPDTELRVAAEEQRRITHVRLRKLLDSTEP